MFFVFIKIIDIDYKEDISMALRSVGITKVSSIDSWNLERSFSDEITLFTGFFKTGLRDEQLILTGLAEEKNQIEKLLENLRIAGIDIDGKEILRVLAWPISLMFDPETGYREF